MLRYMPLGVRYVCLSFKESDEMNIYSKALSPTKYGHRKKLQSSSKSCSPIVV